VSVGREDQFDPRGQVLLRLVERVDVREQLRDHDPVMLDREAALERFAELRDLGAHLAVGELGELLGVADTGQQRVEHRPRGLRVAGRGDAR
jgi:hypothetical protein